MVLSGQEFIRRFLLHILPKDFCKIRYYGIFASRNKRTAQGKCRKAMRFATPGAKLAGLSWQEALKEISGIDLAVCPVCKKGTVVRVAELKGCHAPPRVDMSNMFFETAD